MEQLKNTEWIKSVKEQWDNIENRKVVGYLVNGNISVPKADGNRYYEEIKEYIRNKGYIGPQYTDEELATKEAKEAEAKARQYLKDTDWYVVRYTETSAEIPADVKSARAEARLAIEGEE